MLRPSKNARHALARRHIARRQLALISDKHRNKKFLCSAEYCGAFQRMDTSSDKTVSGLCNSCLKKKVKRDGRGMRLYQCQRCSDWKRKSLFRDVEGLQQCRACSGEKANRPATR